MAFKIVNNTVIDDSEGGFLENLSIDGTSVLVGDGSGNVTLQNLTIDGATVSISGGAAFTTDDINEGLTNLYYTEARVDANFATKTTDDLTEGSNLYYTDARAQAVSINALSEDASPLLSANLDANDNSINNALTIVMNSASPNPLYAEGVIFYDSVNKALSYYNDNSDVAVNMGREHLTRVVNNTGSVILNGSACYISGSDGVVPEISLSKADTIVTSNVTGVATHDIADGEYGYITVLGTVRGLSTSLYSAGDEIYLSDTIPGAWTTTPPTFPSYVVSLGVVSKIDAADGEVEIRIHSHAFESLQVDGMADFEIGLTSYDDIDVTGNRVVNLAAPLLNTDAATKQYVDSSISSGVGALTTDDVPEGSLNAYYLDSRARAAISVTGSGTYNPTTGVIDIQGGVTSVNSLTGDVILSTTEISEGSNLYYTAARFNTAFSGKSTSDLSEGINLYYTDARVDANFATKTTDDLTEGANLYYTTARFNTAFGGKTTTDLLEGSNLYYTDARFDSRLSLKSTTDLSEGANLYYTTARANSAIDARVTKSFVDALGIQATGVTANSVALGTDTTGNYVATVAGTGGEINVTGSGTESAAITLSLPDEMVVPQNLTVTGNLTVNGTTITNDTSTVAVNDPYITVGGMTPLQSDDNKDRGVRFRWHDGDADTVAGSFITGHVYIITSTGTTDFTLIGATDSNPGTVFTATGPGTGTGTANDEINTHLGFFGFDDSDNSFFYIPDATESGETFSGTLGNAKFTTVTANLVGNVTGNTSGTHTGAVVGNASTATALQTARSFSLVGDVITASPVSFNGTGDVVLNTVIQPNSVALGTDTSGNYVAGVTAGTGILVSGSGIETATVTVSHADTSSQASVNNSNGVVIQDITLDDFGHITAIGSLDLDGRYYTETESDARFINTAGDTMTGYLTLNADPVNALHAVTKQYVDSQITGGVVESANKWTTARTITLTGDASGNTSIDGSANVSLAVTVADNSHNHTIANVTGLTAYTDDLDISTSAAVNGTLARRNVTTGDIAATSFTGALNGNASTATKWATARTITLAGDLSGSTSIDGSANVTITAAVLDDSHTHDGRYYTEAESDARFANVTGDTFTGNVTAPTFIGNLSGNATTATTATSASSAAKWTTARTITLAGDLSGNVSIDGSANVTLTATVVDDSHNHVISNVDGLQAELDAKLNSSIYTAADVLAKIKTVDGAGSGLDADLLDGVQAASFLRSDATDSASGVITFTNTTAATSATTGAVVITGGLGVGGAIYAGADVTAYSDERLKENIAVIPDALDKVAEIRGVTYIRKSDGQESTGVIAQDVEKVLPQAVTTDDEGIMAVKYGNMIGLLIESIKELKSQNEQMASEISALKDRLNS